MADTVIEIALGKLEGFYKDGVYNFLGIPYAKAPIGYGRWATPKSALPWKNVLKVDSFGPGSAQIRSGAISSLPGDPQENDEDCLFVNIWTPSLNGEKLPVMFFIHGGAFLTGSTSQFMYNGAALSRKGVVVVSAAYRLGALGFMAHPDLADEETGLWGNFGLADQIEALSFVQQNISAFGGDTDNVTVFGQSAGSMSAVDLMGANTEHLFSESRRAVHRNVVDTAKAPLGPNGKPLFKKLIAQSGGVLSATKDAAIRIAERMAGELGVNKITREAFCGLETKAILAAQAKIVSSIDEGLGMPFQPVTDGLLLSRHPASQIASGAGSDIDILVGTNQDEFRLFALSVPGLDTLSLAGVAKLVGSYLEAAGIAKERLNADEVVDFYASRAASGEASVSPRRLLEAIGTDWIFTVPVSRLAISHALTGGKAFRYRFDKASPFMNGALGACHGIELPFVFGTTTHPIVSLFSGNSQAVQTLSDKVQAAWISFAYNGDPSCETLGKWSEYELAGRQVMRFDDDSEVVDDLDEDILSFWDTHLGKYGEAGPIEGAQPSSVAHMATGFDDLRNNEK
ncbi:MAG: carboxylesterase family protein [Firmicutes bacterium]|jgi:para-nitrobenzyl esterase|nr:carboxylesterase family protein [Bacillota bacterium]